MKLTHSSWLAGLLLILLALSTFLGRQTQGGLRSFDDAYYAQKAVEQLADGGSWVSRHGGNPRYDNPPLHFWATALCYRVWGVSRFMAVLVTGLFATGTVLLVYVLGLALFDRRGPAFLAGLILVLPGFFMDYARRGMLDQTLVFFTSAALAALYFAERGRGRRSLYLPLYGLALGAAMLTKSVIGALIVPTAVIWLLASRGFRGLRAPGFWLASLLGGGLFAIWVWMNARHGGRAFWDEHFAWLILDRAVHDAGESGWGFLLGYLKLLGGNYWPWLPFTLIGGVLAWRARRREGRAEGALLLIWILLPLLVMSLTRNQFLRYILNIFPALALLSAWGLSTLLERRAWLGRGNAVLTALALLVAATINFTDFAPAGATGLRPQSMDVLALAPVIAEHTLEGETVLNYRLGTWVPRNALLFHAGRWLEAPLREPAALNEALAAAPRRALLTHAAGFAELDSLRPGLLREVHHAENLVFAIAVDAR